MSVRKVLLGQTRPTLKIMLINLLSVRTLEFVIVLPVLVSVSLDLLVARAKEVRLA